MKSLLLKLLKGSDLPSKKELKLQLRYRFPMKKKSNMKYFTLFLLKAKQKEWGSF